MAASCSRSSELPVASSSRPRASAASRGRGPVLRGAPRERASPCTRPARCPRPRAGRSSGGLRVRRRAGRDLVGAALEHLHQVRQPSTMVCRTSSASSALSATVSRSSPPTVSCMRRTLPTISRRSASVGASSASRTCSNGDPGVREQATSRALLEPLQARSKRVDGLRAEAGHLAAGDPRERPLRAR